MIYLTPLALKRISGITWTDPMIITAEYAGGNVYRNLFYQVALNYARTFGRNELTGLALFNREQKTTGSNFPSYREDWVGRITYNFDQRYFIEVNAAYNGSEKFGPEYRFGFFPSVAVGWIISNEKFFEGIADKFNKLKLRYSNGKVGSDAGIDGGCMWADGKTCDGRMQFGYPLLKPSWDFYGEGVIPNPDIQWEVAHKRDIGLETSFLDYMLSLDVDFFWEDRDNIFMSADQRTIPRGLELLRLRPISELQKVTVGKSY